MGEEKVNEDLPEKIRRVAKAVGLVWSEDYSRYAHLLLVDAADEIARLRADHERRVTELLEANGREVERRRRVEAELARLRAVLRPLAELARTRTVAHAYQQGILLSLSNGERMCGVDPKALLEASMALEETGEPQP